jgi:hypothetical protein
MRSAGERARRLCFPWWTRDLLGERGEVLKRQVTADLLDPLSKVGRYVFLTGTTVLAGYIGVRILLDPAVEAVMWGIYGFVVAASIAYVGILIADRFVSRVFGWLRRAS